MMGNKETDLLDYNKNYYHKCDQCNTLLEKNEIFPLEKRYEYDDQSINRLITSKINDSKNQGWIHERIAKDMEITTKQIITSSLIILITILIYFLVTGSFILLIITYIPLIYLLYKSIRFVGIRKDFIKDGLTFNPTIEEFNINLNQNRIFTIKSLLVLDKNSICIVCEEKLLKSTE
jgi:hypothetical protein